MKEVFTHPDLARVGLYHSLLAKQGILTHIRNENNVHAPVPLFYPSLCVMDEGDYEAAKQLITQLEAAPNETGPDWQCAQCQEAVPSNFDTCWKCGAARG